MRDEKQRHEPALGRRRTEDRDREDAEIERGELRHEEGEDQRGWWRMR